MMQRDSCEAMPARLQSYLLTQSRLLRKRHLAVCSPSARAGIMIVHRCVACSNGMHTIPENLIDTSLFY